MSRPMAYPFSMPFSMAFLPSALSWRMSFLFCASPAYWLLACTMLSICVSRVSAFFLASFSSNKREGNQFLPAVGSGWLFFL